MLSPVQNKKVAELKQTNLFSLAIHPTIGKVRITSESEIGHSVEGNMIPLYTALQVYAPIHGIFAIKPMAGWNMLYKKIANNEYRWTWTVPVTAKLKVGSSLRNFQCFEIILLFDFKVLVAKSLSQILDNCIVIVFYFKPKRSVIIKIIIKWVAFVTFLSCYKDCSII